jgi:nitrate/nitrite-specific signal transduction histidine kinase
MNSEIPWTKTIASKLSAVFLLLVVISVAVAWTNQHFLSRIKGDSAAINQLGQGRTRASEMLLLSYKIANASGELRTTAITRLREVIELTDHRTQVFIQGDPTTGVLPASDDRILSQLRDRDQVWRTDVKPLLQQIINVPAETDARNTLALIELQVPKFAKELDDSVSSYQGISEEKSRPSRERSICVRRHRYRRPRRPFLARARHSAARACADSRRSADRQQQFFTGGSGRRQRRNRIACKHVQHHDC